MKRDERKRMKELQEKYSIRAQAINNHYNKFINDANNFRAYCVGEVFKLKSQDKELKVLQKMDEEVYQKNYKKKKELMEIESKI